MSLPETFDFTQSNLQDYIDCPIASTCAISATPNGQP